MQSAMESAVSLVTVYDVKPFRSLMVTLTFFGLNASSSNRDAVGTDDGVAGIKEEKPVFSLQDQYPTGVLL